MAEVKESRPIRKSRLVIFGLLVAFTCFLILEVGLRIYLAFEAGPGVLLHGIVPAHEAQGKLLKRRTRAFYEEYTGNYWKYSPNQTKYDVDKKTKELFEISINNRGFRGKDFFDTKELGVTRVVTLGASSTFGYGNRDDETYPYYLEEILNSRRHGAGSFEVINLGIPHFLTDQIVSVFLQEALNLDPDVVTFYEGINDSSDTKTLKKTLRHVSLVRKLVIPLYQRLVSVKFIVASFKAPKKFSEQEINSHMDGKSERFLRNLSLIRDECERRGIVFIVANQQAKSFLVGENDIKGITYDEELELLRKKLSEESSLDAKEMYLYIHSVLMRDLASWAAANNVPFVDVIGALDKDRGVLSSWVHLSPEGNRAVAEILAQEILKQRNDL